MKKTIVFLALATFVILGISAAHHRDRSSGPKPGDAGILYSDNPAHADVLIYNRDWKPHGLESIAVGTPAVYVGPAPQDVPGLTGPMIRVSIRAGSHSGESGTTLPYHWRPTDH